jgi:hypothetical protein
MSRRLSIQQAWLVPGNASQDSEQAEDEEACREDAGATRAEDSGPGWIPIFIAVCALPGGVPCPLHVFEPRYRLLINHVLDREEGEPEFGMTAAPAQPGTMPEYGTMLKVRRSTQFPDGRVALDTVGVRRFRVKETNTAGAYLALYVCIHVCVCVCAKPPPPSSFTWCPSSNSLPSPPLPNLLRLKRARGCNVRNRQSRIF